MKSNVNCFNKNNIKKGDSIYEFEIICRQYNYRHKFK